MDGDYIIMDTSCMHVGFVEIYIYKNMLDSLLCVHVSARSESRVGPMAHEQKPKSDEAKSLCDDSIRETEMQKSVCRFHWLGFDQSFRLLSIHRNEIASGSIAVNKISLGQVIPLMIAGYLSDNGIGRCPHIKSVKVRYVVPSGALVGIYEDLELRDGGSNYLGKIQDQTQQTDIDNFVVSGVMEPKTIRPIVSLLCAKLGSLTHCLWHSLYKAKVGEQKSQNQCLLTLSRITIKKKNKDYATITFTLRLFRPREKLSQTRIPRRLRWISPASATLLLPPPSEAAMFLSMAMMVTTPPSCIRPPPDPQPSSCLNTLLFSRCYSPHTAPPLTMFPSGPDFTTPSPFPLHLLSSLLCLLLVNAGASQLEGGLTGSGRSHLFDYMHCQPDLIPATPPPPGRVTTGRETSSPLRSRASPMQSPQEARPSENPDSSSFIQSLFESDDWQFGVCSAKPSWFLHVIYSLLDSHSPSILVNAKSSQLGLCFLYGHGASHQKLLSVIIPTVAYRCINVIFDYQFALEKKMKFLHGTLYTAELDSPLESSIFQCFVMLFIIIPPSSMAPGSSTLIVNSVAL
ncbi:LOW QUALITY PROTEIN: hypothetical protein HID58_044310 [Brassica napus]|uniref:Uncharacterized protein n=1 Tax=Brassica napus TaxID=3708 RepID=A0ABQ8BK12_BRANA|nr:LOW QUALITY PROTEIN: hypothetical protein HID58_044310 [Brassica napus]